MTFKEYKFFSSIQLQNVCEISIPFSTHLQIFHIISRYDINTLYHKPLVFNVSNSMKHNLCMYLLPTSNTQEPVNGLYSMN